MLPLFLGVFIFLLLPLPAYAEGGLVLNEIYPHPTAGNKEWVEIYNPSSQSISTQDWLITEKTGAGNTTPHSLPNIELPSHQNCYHQFSSPVLNNTEDTVSLVDNNSTIIDSYSYPSTIQGKSYSRIPDGGSWHDNQEPTLAVDCLIFNIPTPSPTQTPTPSPTKTPTPTKITIANPTKTASTPTQAKTTNNPTTSQTAILGAQTATSEASGETSHIKLTFNDQDKKPDKPLIKGDSYSKYIAYGLIGIGVLVVGAPLILFLKKKYG